ncbi:GNAT superfamily N-acetyltransferase [Rossellomorea marisflavi]
MIATMDIKAQDCARSVMDMQIRAYKIEAELIGTADLPPLKESLEDLKQSGETFLGWFEGDVLCGAIAYKIEEFAVDIHRLIVDPPHFRKGIAGKLLTELERLHPSILYKVSTAEKNFPATRFYEKSGYRLVRKLEINDILTLVFFEKEGRS